MKGLKIASIALVLTVLATSFVMASHYGAEPVDIELVADYAVSYRVAPTDEIVDFLVSNGIDSALIQAAPGNAQAARALGKAVDLLARTVEDDVILGDGLNSYVNKALFGAFDNESPFYMELGTARWVIYPTVEE